MIAWSLKNDLYHIKITSEKDFKNRTLNRVQIENDKVMCYEMHELKIMLHQYGSHGLWS